MYIRYINLFEPSSKRAHTEIKFGRTEKAGCRQSLRVVPSHYAKTSILRIQVHGFLVEYPVNAPDPRM